MSLINIIPCSVLLQRGSWILQASSDRCTTIYLNSRPYLNSLGISGTTYPVQNLSLVSLELVTLCFSELQQTIPVDIVKSTQFQCKCQMLGPKPQQKRVTKLNLLQWIVESFSEGFTSEKNIYKSHCKAKHKEERYIY